MNQKTNNSLFVFFKGKGAIMRILPFACLAFLCFSCVSLPEYPAPPKDYELSKTAQIRLVRANEHWAYFGDDDGAITFSDQYKVVVPDDWESSNGGWFKFSKKMHFNDKATFNIPAGEYVPCTQKIITLPGPLPFVNGHQLERKCYKDETFNFEPGGKYEMYILYTYDTDNLYNTIETKWNLQIVDIKKVNEFRPIADNK